MKNWESFWRWLMIEVVKNLNQVSMNDLLLLKRKWEESESKRNPYLPETWKPEDEPTS